jgi:hypothetical protein
MKLTPDDSTDIAKTTKDRDQVAERISHRFPDRFHKNESQCSKGKVECSETNAVQLVHPDERVDQVQPGVWSTEVRHNDALQFQAKSNDRKQD